jgi:WD40 repeat protein
MNLIKLLFFIYPLFYSSNLLAIELQLPLVSQGEPVKNVEILLAKIMPREPVLAIAISADGKTLASVSENTVYLWDIAAGQQTQRLKADAEVINAIAFNPNGTLLAAGTSDDSIYVWRVDTGQPFQQLKKHTDDVNAVAFSPDGQMLATGAGDGTLYLWDLTFWQIHQQLEGHIASVNTLAFSPDSQYLASGGSDTFLYLWDVQTGQKRQDLKGHSDTVTTVQFSPDSQFLASGSWDKTVRVWNVSSGQEIQRFEGHSHNVNTVAFNSTGRILASSAMDNNIRLWDRQSGLELKKQLEHGDNVTAVTFSHKGQLLASSSWDKTVCLWNIQVGEQVQCFEGHSSPVNVIAFTPDGQTLAVGSDDYGVILWEDLSKSSQPSLFQSEETLSNVFEIRRLATNYQPIKTMALSPDGQLVALATTDKMIHLFDKQSGNKVRDLKAHSAEINTLAFSPNGKILASGSRYSTESELSDIPLCLWDVQTGKALKQLAGHTDHVMKVAFSPDGQILASASDDKTIRLWQVGEGPVHPPSNNLVGWVERSETHQTHSSPSSNNLVGWIERSETHQTHSSPPSRNFVGWVERSETHQRFSKDILAGHTQFITGVAFSPDGKTLASGSWDKTVRLWDVQSAQEIKRLEGHTDHITTVAFSPDSKTIASGSRDKTVRLWDAQSSLPLGGPILTGHTEPITTIAFSPNGKTLASGSADKTVRLWHVKTGELQQVMTVGARNTWVNCQIPTQQCWRVDDGTLLVNQDSQGSIESVLPLISEQGKIDIKSMSIQQISPLSPPENGNPIVEIVPLTEPLELTPDKPITLIFTLQNISTAPVFWINVTQLDNQDNSDDNGLIFYPPKTHIVLKPNEKIDLPVKIGAWVTSKTSQNQEMTLALSINSANATTIELPSIPMTIKIPSQSLWTLYISLSALVILSFLFLYYFSIYRHPLVQTLSTDSQQLLMLPLEQLAKAKRLLKLTRRLDTVLLKNHSNHHWLEEAIAYNITQSNQIRCELLAKRLSANIPKNHEKEVFTLQFNNSTFPLKLDRCIIYFPAPHLPAQEVIWRLQQDDLNFQVTLVMSFASNQQTALRAYGENRTNLWVVPTSPELSALLLSPNPITLFVRLLANQLPMTRISPYQTRGGVTKDSAFFGREKILAQIFNRELMNYLVIGGRQVGKTSLLKQIERHYQNHPNIECIYLSVSRGDKRAIEDYLADLPTKRQRLLLIDEADIFIRQEIAEDYETLSHFRNLTEEGRCYFIIAGFWDLYEAVLNYHSPVKNFGESIMIGALELEACQKLATEPMQMLDIHYASAQLVEQMILKTGQRANLIATVCDNMLQQLATDQKAFTQQNLDQALQSHAIIEKISSWRTLTDDKQAARLDRIIVYATINQGPFQLSQVMALLDEYHYNYSTEQLMQSLARLELAFIIQRQDHNYHYCVPLFREWLMTHEVDALLKQEIKHQS